MDSARFNADPARALGASPLRVLVLGGSGFLGAHVVAAAVRAGHVVISASRSPESGPAPARGPAVELAWCDATREQSHGCGAGPESVPARATALESLEELLERARPDLVISCAALSRLDDCASDPSRARRLNTEAPRRIARWFAHEQRRLVHVSTDLVFDGEPLRPKGYRETDEAQPLSEYGRTKLAGERAVLSEDPRALVVRLPLLFGDSFGRGLGASDSILAAIARGERPTLFTDEWRTPLDVALAASALLELAACDLSGVLHVAGPERLSRHDLGLRVLARHHIEADRLRAGQRSSVPEASTRPRDVALDTTLLAVSCPSAGRVVREGLFVAGIPTAPTKPHTD